MLVKTVAKLIYATQTTRENGSPVELTIEKEVRADNAGTFSNNYYNDRARAMRDSLNLNVNVYYTYDIVGEDGLSYSLKYVEYDGKKYTVEGILARYMKNYKKDLYQRTLDLKRTL